jgi:hypothetical protein
VSLLHSQVQRGLELPVAHIHITATLGAVHRLNPGTLLSLAPSS